MSNKIKVIESFSELTKFYTDRDNNDGGPDLEKKYENYVNNQKKEGKGSIFDVFYFTFKEMDKLMNAPIKIRAIIDIKSNKKEEVYVQLKNSKLLSISRQYLGEFTEYSNLLNKGVITTQQFPSNNILLVSDSNDNIIIKYDLSLLPGGNKRKTKKNKGKRKTK